MNALQLIPLDRLKPRGNQVRREFQRIGELARSIELHSLLQNLVVRPGTPEGFFEIVAGERRYRALKLLQQEGRLKSTDVPCALLGTDGFIENIVENVGREDIPLWDLGRVYVTLSDSGLTQLEIAEKVGRTQGHVSTATILAKNLAPPVIERLAKLPNAFPVQRLLRLARLVDENGDPDEKSQQKLFKQMLESPGRRGRKAGALVSQKQTVWTRFESLKQGKQNRFVDPVYQPVLEAVVRYLSGETKGIHV